MTAHLENMFFCVTVTLICYFFSLQLFKKYKKSWLNPLYTGSLLLISLLLAGHIHSGTFQQGTVIFNKLLQLSVIALAVPLYKQWAFLKKNYRKIFAGVFFGTGAGIALVVTLSQVFHLNSQLLASLIPRSVTLPIALTVSDDLGGLASLTVIFVVISGLISLSIGPNLLKSLGVRSSAARGLAMGTSAQMLGANHALLWGDEEGAMGSVAMTTSAVMLSISIPVLALILKYLS